MNRSEWYEIRVRTLQDVIDNRDWADLTPMQFPSRRDAYATARDLANRLENAMQVRVAKRTTDDIPGYIGNGDYLGAKRITNRIDGVPIS